MNTHKIIQGDCIAGMQTLPDGCIHTCITSPPYWGLRDYGTATWEGGDAGCDHIKKEKIGLSSGLRNDGREHTGMYDGEKATKMTMQYNRECRKCGAKRIDAQLGAEKSPEEYVENLVKVFREVRRVLRDDGTVWLNLGDSYWSNTLSRKDPVESMWGNRPASDLTDGRDNIPTRNQRGGLGAIPNGIKPKDLMGMPWRVAFALQADGWYLRQDIIWHKPNPMPESTTDRCTKAHEYIFLLSKNKHYYFDHEAIREPAASTTAARALRGLSDNHKLVNGAPGQSPHGMNKPRPRQFGATIQEGTNRGDVGRTFVDTGKRNKRSVWTVNTGGYKGAHFAVYPKKLIEPCVLAGTSEHGCCSKCGVPWQRQTNKPTYNLEPVASIDRKGIALTPEDSAIVLWIEDNGGDYRISVDGDKHTEQWNDIPISNGRQTQFAKNGYTLLTWGEGTVENGWAQQCKCKDATVEPCTVFDPFTGSGTTAVVALKNGRNFVGTELNPEYIKIAEARITEEIPTTLTSIME